ncbi:BTB/POZ domain-containing protein [Acorus calamus]|uniref:BTB/POZ domain-containing protein n=1 Tax=Acorus calamus TaxID=4465 RepID=A0AAV9FEF0_ACOCL|nr:BTB/POZ domain-containing protein [Acorus calamus]
MAKEKLVGSKGQAWFCTTGLPSDVVVEVGEMSFHLHKFPLMSSSRKLQLLITEQEQSNPNRQTEEDEEEEEIEEEAQHVIALHDFPGGAEAFEAAAKFCYGVKVDITAANVAALRCAAEYLEMTSDGGGGGDEESVEPSLASRSERFLSHTVLRSLRDSIRVLKSCEHLLPLAEELAITRRCIDSIAAKVASLSPDGDPALFGWPINDDGPAAAAGAGAVLWNGIDTGLRRQRNPNSWIDDLTVLCLPFYGRVVDAMKSRGAHPESVEASLVHYAKKSIPGLTRSTRKTSSASLVTEAEQRGLIEIVVANLPSKTSSNSRFLFGLLRTACILGASQACRDALERLIGRQLERATLDDLLVPSYSYLIETLYDVNCVERILGHFLDGLDERDDNDDDDEAEADPVVAVGRLIDGYLAEIASDANLDAGKFCNLAMALPDRARVYDDGLYRAVDVFLKAHPRLTEEEREKVCGVMDCRKLTLEACTHAAQNERLPLRAVLQVLFFEQLQLRQAIAGTLGEVPPSPPQAAVRGEVGVVAGGGDVATWRKAVRENQVLRLDMDSVRSRVHELERECSTMKRAIEKIDRPRAAVSNRATGGIGSLLGCKFKSQVSDSHGRAGAARRVGGKASLRDDLSS